MMKAKNNNDYHLAKQLLYRTNEKYLEPYEEDRNFKDRAAFIYNNYHF